MEAVNAKHPGQPVNLSPMSPVLPQHPGQRHIWGNASPASVALAIAHSAKQYRGLLLVVVDDMQAASQMANHLRFFLEDPQLPVLSLPDWETLPYDIFSPLPEIISQRLEVLYKLRGLDRGILIVPVGTMMLRLPPQSFLDANSLIIAVADTLRLEDFQLRLANAGYLPVAQVTHHGEFAVRGSLIDLFPMGGDLPYRIDLFDEEVDSIRTFDPETQRTAEHVASVRLLPAREFPTDEAAVSAFRKAHRERLDGNPHRSQIYRQVSDGNLPGGIEYYLPLFFAELATLFDYLPKNVLLLEQGQARTAGETFFAEICERYEQRRHDLERPLLTPDAVYLTPQEVQQRLAGLTGIRYQHEPLIDKDETSGDAAKLAQRPLPALSFQGRSSEPAAQLKGFLASSPGRVLFVAETAGRREHLLESLRAADLRPVAVKDWLDFLGSEMPLAITVAPIEDGLWLEDPPIVVLPEALLLGERVRQERRRRRSQVGADQVVRNLAELHIGSPVVHEDHGVGRYLGLQILDIGGLNKSF